MKLLPLLIALAVVLRAECAMYDLGGIISGGIQALWSLSSAYGGATVLCSNLNSINEQAQSLTQSCSHVVAPLLRTFLGFSRDVHRRVQNDLARGANPAMYVPLYNDMRNRLTEIQTMDSSEESSEMESTAMSSHSSWMHQTREQMEESYRRSSSQSYESSRRFSSNFQSTQRRANMYSDIADACQDGVDLQSDNCYEESDSCTSSVDYYASRVEDLRDGYLLSYGNPKFAEKYASKLAELKKEYHKVKKDVEDAKAKGKQKA